MLATNAFMVVIDAAGFSNVQCIHVCTNISESQSVLSSKHGVLSVNSLCNYIPKIATRIKNQGMPFCRKGHDSSDMLFKTHRTVMIMLQNPNAACCL